MTLQPSWRGLQPWLLRNAASQMELPGRGSTFRSAKSWCLGRGSRGDFGEFPSEFRVPLGLRKNKCWKIWTLGASYALEYPSHFWIPRKTNTSSNCCSPLDGAGRRGLIGDETPNLSVVFSHHFPVVWMNDFLDGHPFRHKDQSVDMPDTLHHSNAHRCRKPQPCRKFKQLGIFGKVHFSWALVTSVRREVEDDLSSDDEAEEPPFEGMVPRCPKWRRR